MQEIKVILENAAPSKDFLEKVIPFLTGALVAIVSTFAIYIKDKSLKKQDIMRKDLSTLYTLNNEILLNKKILESNLRHMEALNKEEINFYVTGLIPQNNTWEIVKKENILCVVDDRILTEKLFDFYAFIDQSIIIQKHESEEVNKGTVKRDVLIEVMGNIECILERIDLKIEELYKKLK